MGSLVSDSKLVSVELKIKRTKNSKTNICWINLNHSFLSTQVILPALVQKRHPIAPQSLKIVVDTMLQGLGQHLRCCGVDVVILDNSGDHSKAVEVGDDFCRPCPFY